MGINSINKPDGVGAIGADVGSPGARRKKSGVDPVNPDMSSLTGSDLGNGQGGDAVTISDEARKALEGEHQNE